MNSFSFSVFKNQNGIYSYKVFIIIAKLIKSK